MPQIAQLSEVWSSQIFWMLVTFGFVFLVIGLGMVPKVQSTVDKRDEKISSDLAVAKHSFASADTLEENWRKRQEDARSEAQAVMAAAKAKASKQREAALAKADASIAETVADAEAVIAGARSAAMTQLEAVAADAASALVMQVSGAQITPQAALNAVKALNNG